MSSRLRFKGSDAGKNLVIVLALVAAGFFAAYRFVLPKLAQGASFTDGERLYEGPAGEGIRYAVWDEPEALGGNVNTPAHESRPALSLDGRWMVFAVGREGLNSDLYVCEMIRGVAGEPQPIATVNTVADEMAPAFGPAGLYFASNRGGGSGGFDLYCAPFQSGPSGLSGADVVFGPAEWLDGTGVNTPVDETDPAPAPQGLFFSSNRGLAGFDIYVSRRAPAPEGDRGQTEVVPVEPLNSRFDEREPSLTADGRTLFFASDRGAEVGRFALYRSLEEGSIWLRPRKLSGLDVGHSQRGPHPSADGFTLFFEGSEAAVGVFGGGPSDLYRARSLELFRLPTPSIGWLDVLLLIGLLCLALLAWLAKRWEQLDVLYRCVLLSILIHLLLMWWFRHLHPEPEVRPLGPGPDATFQVRMLSDHSAGGGLRERAGALEVARAERAQAESPQRHELERPETSAVSAASTGPAPAREFARAQVELGPAPDREAREFAPTTASADGNSPAPELRDRERGFERMTEGSPAMAIAARSAAAERSLVESSAAPLRAQLEAPSRASLPAISSASSATRRMERKQLELDPSGAAYTPQEQQPSALVRGRSSAAPGPELAQPRESFEARRETPAASAAPSMPEPTKFTARREPRARLEPELDTGPLRLASAAPIKKTETRPEPEFRPLTARADERPPAPLPEAPRRLQDTPYRSRFGSQKEVALETYGGSEATERAVAEGLAYLASIQSSRGHWGSRSDFDDKYHHVMVGKTGLALLAFLGAGHTPQSRTLYSENTERAIDFLIGIQDDERGHFGDSSSYSHGIAAYALGECYAITGEQRLRGPIERAVRRILGQQVRRGHERKIGGWGYYFPDGHSVDAWPRVSITSWQIMALESARLGGIDIPEQAVDGARDFLIGSWDRRMGAFRYSHDPQRLRSGYATLPGSTPAALFALSLLGEDIRGRRYDAARRFVVERAPRGYGFTSSDDFVFNARGNLYFWYYGSLALLRSGGNQWDRWNTAMQETLLPAQERDGSWVPIDVYARYAGDDDSDRSYTTSLCVLTLEVYYRYFTPLLQVR